jgi:ABC-type sugar transport system ATPase subunit
MNFFEGNHNFFKELNFDVDGIVLGIRPEDFSIIEEESYLYGEIISIQTLGKEVYLKVIYEETCFTVCARWNYNYEVGQKINLKIRKIYIFDSKGVCHHVTD